MAEAEGWWPQGTARRRRAPLVYLLACTQRAGAQAGCAVVPSVPAVPSVPWQASRALSWAGCVPPGGGGTWPCHARVCTVCSACRPAPRVRVCVWVFFCGTAGSICSTRRTGRHAGEGGRRDDPGVRGKAAGLSMWHVTSRGAHGVCVHYVRTTVGVQLVIGRPCSSAAVQGGGPPVHCVHAYSAQGITRTPRCAILANRIAVCA